MVLGNEKTRTRQSFLSGPQKIDLLHPLVVYLAEDLLPEEELVREVIVCMKDFTGQQRVKAGLSQMVGSPTLALL